MGFVKKYTNLSLGGVAGPVTLLGQNTTAITVATAGVPCRGARMIVFRCKATNAVVPTAMSVNVGNSPLRSELWLSGAGGGIQTRGTVGVRCDQTGGNTFAAVCPDARGTLAWDFMQFLVAGTITAGSDITGFNVDAEVYYDTDADLSAQLYGQPGLTVSGT